MRLEEYLITEDKNTEFLETSALLGAVCDDDTMKKISDILKNPEKFKENGTEILKTFESLIKFDGKYDWSSSGKAEIESIVKSNNINRIITVFSLTSVERKENTPFC